MCYNAFLFLKTMTIRRVKIDNSVKNVQNEHILFDEGKNKDDFLETSITNESKKLHTKYNH